MQAHHAQPFQKRPGSRASIFDAEERPVLRPLPAVAYEISRWIYGRKVRKDGHVVFEKNFYSAPYAHVGSSVDLRITETTVEIFSGQERLTSHLLPPGGVINTHHTHAGDLPDGQRYQQWDGPRVREWATRVGENTTTVINLIFESVPVEEQGLNAALAVLRLSRRFSPKRVEAAAGIAVAGRIRSPRYAHLRPIVDSGQDTPASKRRRSPEPSGLPAAGSTPTVGFVRGPDYYAGGQR